MTEKTLDPASGDDWARVYYFSFLAPLLEEPPITYEGIKDHVQDSAELKKDLQKIQNWYTAHKSELEKASSEEEKELDKVRELLRK